MKRKFAFVIFIVAALTILFCGCDQKMQTSTVISLLPTEYIPTFSPSPTPIINYAPPNLTLHYCNQEYVANITNGAWKYQNTNGEIFEEVYDNALANNIDKYKGKTIYINADDTISLSFDTQPIDYCVYYWDIYKEHIGKDVPVDNNTIKIGDQRYNTCVYTVDALFEKELFLTRLL